MHAFNKSLALLLLTGSFAMSLQAQDLTFEHISVDDGLPQNSVRAIVQDHLGFLWLATQDGLAKYDGYRFTTYRHDPDDSLSFTPDGFFPVMHEDRQGAIWIGTLDNGLVRFDRETETFIHYRHDPDNPMSISGNWIASLQEDQQGNLWLATGPTQRRSREAMVLDRLDPETGEVTRFRHDPDDPTSLGSGNLFWCCPTGVGFLAFHEDSDGVIWIGLQQTGGLNRFDPETETFTHFKHDPNDPSSLSHNEVNDVYEDREGNLWVGTASGLNLMDRSRGTFTRYLHDPADPDHQDLNSARLIHEDRQGILWVATRAGLTQFDPGTGTFTRRYMHNLEGPDPPSNRVLPQPFLEDQYGDFWFQTEGEGMRPKTLQRYDRAADRLTYYRADPNDPTSITVGTRLEPYYEDRSGVLWFGTWGGGLNKLDRSSQKFLSYRHDPNDPNSLSSNSVRAFYEDQEGILWIGTSRGGLNRLDRRTGQFTHYMHNPENAASISNDNVLEITEDHEGMLWVGTYGGGLNRFDRSTGRFTPYLHNPDDPYSLASDLVHTVYVDRMGELWVGSQGNPRNAEQMGMQRFDRETERFTHYQYEPFRPPDNRVFSIHEDKEGDFWIGTNLGGLQRFDRETERYTAYYDSFIQSAIPTLYEDRKGRLWVGSTKKGLGRFDRDTGTGVTFTVEDGLVNNAVFGILEDDLGHLWISTEVGVSSFDPEAGTFKTYDVTDGLPSNSFRSGGAYQGADGTMYFGGNKGFIAFHPDQIQDNPNPPPVALTDFSLFDESVSFGADSPLKVPISITESITLRHYENDFSFGFSALHYSSPEKNQYAFMLENYEDAWREVGTQRRATYMNLDPGTYTFRVKASNNDGLWNEEGVSINVIIKPPWWQTTWAYVLYGLLFIAGIIAVDRLQRRRLIRRERQRAEIEQAELREKAAQAVAEIATSEARALKAENERNQVELEKAHELEVAYDELDTAHKHLKATQDQLILAEKMASLGALTAGIAHEIKNPLNFVNNFAQINQELADELRTAIEAGEPTDELIAILEDLKQGAEVINKQGKRADTIVKSMMEHASGGSGQRQQTDVNALVEEYFNLAYHGMRAQNPEFNVAQKRDYGEGLAEVSMVPQEMGRVLINLMNNAFYAVGEKASMMNGGYVPTVRVVTTQVGKEVVIQVEDNGRGITAKDRAKIFEPFYTTKPTGRGNTGLGLSLSYDIVTQGHGGTLTVESEEGEGATFIITLPAHTDSGS